MDWTELSNWTEYTKLLIGLFAISGPLTTLPLFLGLTEKYPESEKRLVALVSVTTFAITMLVFTFFGLSILNIFGISLAAFQIAGGILLLLTALDMMKSEIGKQHDTKTVDGNLATIGIVPIGIPKLAGPGAISTIIIYASEHEALEHAILVSGVILTVAIIIYLIFQMALVMESFFGETATVVMSKVMGLIVASLGIEAIIHGIAGHFPDLTIIH